MLQMIARDGALPTNNSHQLYLFFPTIFGASAGFVFLAVGLAGDLAFFFVMGFATEPATQVQGLSVRLFEWRTFWHLPRHQLAARAFVHCPVGCELSTMRWTSSAGRARCEQNVLEPILRSGQRGTALLLLRGQPSG